MGSEMCIRDRVCIECGAVDEIKEDLLVDVEKEVERRWHFKVKDHRLTFHGICHRCQEKHKQEELAAKQQAQVEKV